MKLATFKKKGIGYTSIISGVETINKDGSFTTNCIFRGKESPELYSVKETPEIGFNAKIVMPKVPYKLYETTNNPAECRLLAIKYYMGTSYNEVVNFLGGRMFIIDEKIPVEERIPNTEEYKLGRFNEILQYTGWEHLPKKEPKYEGDAHSRIELSEECPYTMFKFIINGAPYEQ